MLFVKEAERWERAQLQRFLSNNFPLLTILKSWEGVLTILESVAETKKEQKSKEVEKAIGAPEERQRIRIRLRSFDHKIIDQAAKTIIESLLRVGATICGPIPLPTEKRVYTVNRSTFVHKDSRDQYEMRIHKRLIDIFDPSESTIEILTNLSLPAGVDIEIKM